MTDHAKRKRRGPFLLRFAVLAGAVLLTACMSMDWSTLRYAKDADWSKFDPATARVAVATPDGGFRHSPLIHFRVIGEDGVVIDKRYQMIIVDDPVELSALPRDARRRDATLFRFTDEDAATFTDDFKAFMGAAKENRAAAERGAPAPYHTLNLFIGLGDMASDKDSFGCKPGDASRLSLWGRISADEPYQRIFNNKRLDKMLGEALAAFCVDDPNAVSAPAEAAPVR